MSCDVIVPDTGICKSMRFMVCVWVVLSVVASSIFQADIPLVGELLVLGSMAPEPPEAHIHHLAPARNNGIVGSPSQCRVISLDREFWSGPPHDDEGLAVGYNHASRDEKRAASLDPAADAIINLMIWSMERISPLNRRKGTFSERKICAPA